MGIFGFVLEWLAKYWASGLDRAASLLAFYQYQQYGWWHSCLLVNQDCSAYASYLRAVCPRFDVKCHRREGCLASIPDSDRLMRHTSIGQRLYCRVLLFRLGRLIRRLLWSVFWCFHHVDCRLGIQQRFRESAKSLDAVSHIRQILLRAMARHGSHDLCKC